MLMSFNRALFAVAFLAIQPCPSPVRAADVADALYFGGPVLTMDDSRPRAEAVAVKDGRILGVGSLDELKAFMGPAVRGIDLAGCTMVPGFVDAHGHVVVGGFQALSANLLPAPDGPGNSIEALQKVLRDWLASNADIARQKQLIVGFGYDNAQLVELRHPTRDDLDKVSTDIRVVIVHQSSHLAVLNSKALQIVGYSAATPNPDGGVIQRRPGGAEPNGVVEESAFFSALPVLLKNLGPDAVKTFARAGLEVWARFGYTTVEEGRAAPGIAAALKDFAEEGGLKVDVNVYADVLIDPTSSRPM
jgi:predicted amidohydrolase YtcJ